MNRLTWARAMIFIVIVLVIVPSAGYAQTPNVKFWADNTSLRIGQCTTLHWQADEGADRTFHLVSPDGKDSQVNGHGQVSFCPPQPQAYRFTFKVLQQDGREFWWIQPIIGNPQPVCTPPVCSPPNQLKCPPGQTCPGGCGVQCLPPPTSSVTWKVSGRVYDSIVGAPISGATVSCQGGGQAAVGQTLDDGTFNVAWEGNNIGELTCTFECVGFTAQTLKPALPAVPPQPKAPTTKQQGRGVAQSTRDYGDVQAILVPNYRQGDGTWAINYVAQRRNDLVGEPVNPMQRLTICTRKFQNDAGYWGYMLWRSGDKRQAILALASNPSNYFMFDDTWDQNSPVACPPSQLKPGQYVPDKGLGWVWCTQNLRTLLGYAIEPQETCVNDQLGRWQDFQRATLVWLHNLNWVVVLNPAGAWSSYDFSPRQPVSGTG